MLPNRLPRPLLLLLLPSTLLLLTLLPSACSEDNGVTVTPKEPGGLCTEASQCRDALCYRGVCTPSGAADDGADCKSSFQCKSFECQAGSCIAGRQRAGGVCLYNEECSSRQCKDATPGKTPGSCVGDGPLIDVGPETAPDAASETAPETGPETAPDSAPDSAPDTAPDVSPDTAPDTTPDSTNVG